METKDKQPTFDLDRFPASELAPKYEMGFGKAEHLGVFGNYRFFTPALLYLHGRFHDQPLLQFLENYKGTCHLMHYRFQSRIFRGLVGEWDHVLWAIEEAAWPAFENWMLSAVMYSSADKTVYRVGSQDLMVIDPLWLDRTRVFTGEPVTLDIVAFGVDSDRRVIAMQPQADPYIQLVEGGPLVKVHPPQAHTRKFAAALFDGGNPSNELPPPLQQLDPNTPPATLRTQDIGELSPEKRAEMLKVIQDYRSQG